MISPKIPIAKEGYPFLGSAVLLTLVLAILGYTSLTVISLVLSFFILFFPIKDACSHKASRYCKIYPWCVCPPQRTYSEKKR